MRAGQRVTFAPGADGRYVMNLPGGDHSLVAPFTHRYRKNFLRCEKCGHLVADGGKAYREARPAKERRFITGIAWCAACVEGGAL